MVLNLIHQKQRASGNLPDFKKGEKHSQKGKFSIVQNSTADVSGSYLQKCGILHFSFFS